MQAPRLLPWIALGWLGSLPAQVIPPVPPDRPSTTAIDPVDRLLAEPATPRQALDAVLAKKGAFRSAAAPVASHAIARELAATDAAVEFVHWQAAAGPRLTAFVLRASGEPVRVDLGDAQVIQQALAAHLQLLTRSQRPLDPASLRLAGEAGKRLAAVLLAPLREAVAGCVRVHFATDGDLDALPFDSLPAANSDNLLLEVLDVRQLKCSSQLIGAAVARGTGLVVVDGGTLDRPGASREARAIAEGWDGASVSPSSRHGAAELATRLAATRNREFVHVAGATNGLVLPAVGTLPAVGARTAATATEAVAQRTEVAACDLTACRLIVLTPPDLPNANAPITDNVVTRWRDALLVAGARSCIVAAWQIDDALARQLLASFWNELRTNDDPATALRRVKLGRLAANRATHGQALAGTWAGFWLFGVGDR